MTKRSLRLRQAATADLTRFPQFHILTNPQYPQARLDFRTIDRCEHSSQTWQYGALLRPFRPSCRGAIPRGGPPPPCCRDVGRRFRPVDFSRTEIRSARPGENLPLGNPLSVHCPHRVGKNNAGDRKSTRLNSSHGYISYAVFCLKKKKNTQYMMQTAAETSTTLQRSQH